MNPKEKAKDLIEKYLRLEDDTLFYWNGYYDRQMLDEEVLSHAKRCAIIAVDEILKSVEHFAINKWQNNYWQEVKKELTI